MAPKFPAEMATPAYVLDVAALKRNLETVARIRREAGDLAGARAALARACRLAPANLRYRWDALTLGRA